MFSLTENIAKKFKGCYFFDSHCMWQLLVQLSVWLSRHVLRNILPYLIILHFMAYNI